MTRTRLGLTRPQILAFRQDAGGLAERLPRGQHSLRRAAWAGLQDSMPRAALLSIHARVEGTEPSAWEDPSLVQLWGPRFNVFVVAAPDLAVFSLGTLPDDAKGQHRAKDLAARLNALLGTARMRYGEAGDALGIPPNSLRYAAATGTVLIRWEGARQPTVWTVPPPEADPRDARLELARRYLHIYGPTAPAAFGQWAGIGPRVADTGADTGRRRVDPHPGRGGLPRRSGAGGTRAAASERRRLSPPPGNRSGPAGPGRRSPSRAVDAACLARWHPRRGRDRRYVAARGRGDDGAALARAVARRTRRGHGGGGVPAATGSRETDRRPLGRLRRG